MMKKSLNEWCDFTWNPVTGCRKSCPFCKGMDILLHFKGDNRLYLSSELIKKDRDKELFILAKPFPGIGTNVVPYIMLIRAIIFSKHL